MITSPLLEHMTSASSLTVLLCRELHRWKQDVTQGDTSVFYFLLSLWERLIGEGLTQYGLNRHMSCESVLLHSLV